MSGRVAILALAALAAYAGLGSWDAQRDRYRDAQKIAAAWSAAGGAPVVTGLVGAGEAGGQRCLRYSTPGAKGTFADFCFTPEGRLVETIRLAGERLELTTVLPDETSSPVLVRPAIVVGAAHLAGVLGRVERVVNAARGSVRACGTAAGRAGRALREGDSGASTAALRAVRDRCGADAKSARAVAREAGEFPGLASLAEDLSAAALDQARVARSLLRGELTRAAFLARTAELERELAVTRTAVERWRVAERRLRFRQGY